MRLLRAFKISVAGIMSTFRSEPAFRLECYLFPPLIVLAAWLGENAMERGILVFSWCCVLSVELLNTAIEAAIDRHGLEQHPLSAKAKDAGSAAVLVVIIAACAVWLGILL